MPSCIVTVGGLSQKDYKELQQFHFEIRKRWLHEPLTLANMHPWAINNCFLTAIEHPTEQNHPLISVVTTAYKSKHRIHRPYQALLHETYTNWEWIVVSDDPPPHEGEEKDNDSNWQTLCKFAEYDIRIRVYRSSHHDGYIGSVKNVASSLARGAFVLELDHDDGIVPQLLEWIRAAAKQFPDAGFFYSDFCELDEITLKAFSYSDDICPLAGGIRRERFNLGFGAYMKKRVSGRWQNVCMSCPINPRTVRSIMGMPNHVRVWRTDILRALSNYQPALPVADDYELLVRTFINSKRLNFSWVRIAQLGYLQYQNTQNNNFTCIRRQLITNLVRLISHRYEWSLHNRLLETGGDYQPLNEEQELVAWDSREVDYPRFEKVWRPDQDQIITIILPTYDNISGLVPALQSLVRQTDEKWEALVIGDACPKLNAFMEAAPLDPRIQYWNLHVRRDDHLRTAMNYGWKMCTNTKWAIFMDHNDRWSEDTLARLRQLTVKHPKAMFTILERPFSSDYVLFQQRPLAERHGYWPARTQIFQTWKQRGDEHVIQPIDGGRERVLSGGGGRRILTVLREPYVYLGTGLLIILFSLVFWLTCD